MRPIKFRAWIKSGFDDDVKPFMADVASLDYSEFGNSLKTPEDDNEWGEKNYIIMQFTGLKDKNGKEIYEGDVVRNERGEIGKIIFSSGAFVSEYLPPYNWDAMEPCDGLLDRQEVIGNIYEHGELLNEK
jgi:hypothetical protein